MLTFRVLPAVLVVFALAAVSGTTRGRAGTGPAVVYVDQSATGGNTGDNWANAYTELRVAIATASDDAEIWVAQGTYRASDPFSRSAFFEPKPGQAIYGGFAGGETGRDQRDPDAYSTVLTADPGTDISTDDAYHAVLFDGASSSAVLDGFRIRAGYADGPGIRDGFGGGIALFDSSPTLGNLVIEGGFANNSGGGIYALGGSPHIENVVVRDSTSADTGGGIGLSASDAALEAVTVSGNRAAEMGGGVYNQTGSARITNSTIARNEARRGAGMANVDASPTIADTSFDENFAYTTSALAVEGGGFYAKNGAPEITRVIFRRNHAEEGDGGAIFVQAGEPILVESSFVANRAGDDGGGVFVAETTAGVTMTAATLAGNSAGGTGGALNIEGTGSLTNITVSGNSASGYGGGVVLSGAVDVQFATITRNHSGPLESAVVINVDGSTIARSIIWSNGPGEVDDRSASGTVVTNDIIRGGCPANSQCQPADALDVDPKLLALADNGGSVRTHAIPASSPAVDTATTCNGLTEDARGFRRPANGNLTGPTGCDLGAYERVPGPTSVQFSATASAGKESLSPAQISVEITDRIDLPVTVAYRVSGGTATGGGVDYQLANGTLTIPARSLARGITFSVTADRFDEPIETIEVELSSPTNASLGGRTVHTYRILDDDPVVRCRGRLATIIGTAGPDVLKGTAGPDVIAGLGGKDSVDAGGGDDTVCAGPGDDTVRGGGGNDIVVGAGGNDTFFGGDGADLLFGLAGKDSLTGGPGALDGCDGGPGTDVLPKGHGCETVARVP